jgi:hypothetical protein
MSIKCKKTPLSTEKGKKDLMPVVLDEGLLFVPKDSL